MATVVPQAGAPLTAQAEFARGTQLFADAKYREAVQALVRAREYDPELKTQATRLVVRSLLRVGDFGRAEQEASSLVTSSVGTEDLSLHAETLWSTGHFEEAHARYTTALTLDARYPAALHGIARVLDARGKTADALVAVERAIERDPEVAEYHHTRAYLLERLGHYGVAADELDRYLRLLPDKGFKDQIKLARARMKFLRHFGDRTPISMGDDVRTQVHVIPFREEREKLFVKARLNGRINTELVLDTGAEMTVLSEDAAQRAQIYSVAETLSAGVGDVGLRRLKLARINKLEIGTLKIEHVPTMIKDSAAQEIPDGRHRRVLAPRGRPVDARRLREEAGHRRAHPAQGGRHGHDGGAALDASARDGTRPPERRPARGVRHRHRRPGHLDQPHRGHRPRAARPVPPHSLEGLRLVGLGSRRVPAARRGPRGG